ncbi:MAG: MauE/DoxX family redox-associated membrane protein [Labedaea sp.]
MARPPARVLDGIGTLARLGLAAVWLVSGWTKVSDPNQTYIAVQAYDLLPDGVVSVVAAAVPFLELALGLLLSVGLGTRVVALVSVVVLLAFIAAVAQSWARGLSIDCGCFGGGGQVSAGQTKYPQEIARDVGFLVLAGWLVIRPRTLLALDGLFGKREERQIGGRSGTQRSEEAAAADGR